MDSKVNKYSPAILSDLKTIFDDCMKEDRAVRERQIRKWRRLKLLWEGFQRIWFSEIAHDWRVWDEQQDIENNSDQAYYDRPINVFRAYLESIIAALSVSVPGIKAFPEDATSSLDLETAKGADKIAELMYRHNNVVLLWLHALFVFSTEGMIAMYHYPHDSDDYGTYEEQVSEDVEEPFNYAKCPECDHTVELSDEDYSGFDQSAQDTCAACGNLVNPQYGKDARTINRVVRTDIKPKTRVCMEVYGGLYVKVPNYAKCQKDIPYLILSNEKDRSMLIEKYYEYIKDDDDLRGCFLDEETQGAYDQYGMWGRLSPQYQSEFPRNVLTENICWLRPAKYYILNDEAKEKRLRKKFPEGVRIVVINDEIICAEPECLDKHWTLSENPLADYLHFEPAGEALTSVQDITNDLISLTLQTIEHGIGQTFVSPDIISTKAYAQTEATPGGIYPTKPLGNKKIGDGIYELRTATLSGEVLPFGQQIQSMAQLASGALPSLFGGQLEGSDTASEYSMSRAQALQRLQNTWRMLTIWWKKSFEKSVPMFIDNMKTDEKDVKMNSQGGFVNVMINRSELTGKIGKVELESSENLPMTWGQRKDVIEKLLTNSSSPAIQAMLTAPENLPALHEYLGLVDFFVPNEESVIKQYEEIQLLLQSAPLPDNQPVAEPGADGQMSPQQPQEVPSVEIDPVYDNHEVEFEIVKKWVTSEEGRMAKTDNPDGYKNVLLHGMQHLQQLQMMAQQQAPQPAAQPTGSGANPAKPKPDFNRNAPIEEENDINQVH
jgi:hypothetical protein